MDIDVSEMSPRERELRVKFKDASERYESVHGRSVSVADLEEYVTHCERKELFDYLQSRVGFLFASDREVVLGILKEATSGGKKSKGKSKAKKSTSAE